MAHRAPVKFRDVSLMNQIKYALLWPYTTIASGDYMGLAVGAGYMYYMGNLQFAGVPWSQLLMNIAQAGIPVFAYEYALDRVIDNNVVLAVIPNQTGARLGVDASAGMSYAPGPMMG